MSDHIFKPTRRDILKFGAAGLASAPFVIEDRPPQAVQDAYYQAVYDRMLRQGVKPDARGAIRLALSARYLTDAERINRMLHPPFTPDDRPEVLLCWFLILSPPASGNIFVPGWTRCRLIWSDAACTVISFTPHCRSASMRRKHIRTI